MRIEIIKPFKLLQVGQVLDIDSDYSKSLINRGFAKSLEDNVEVSVPEKAIEKSLKVKK